MISRLLDRITGAGQKAVRPEQFYASTITLADETRGRTSTYSPTDAAAMACFASITGTCATRIANQCASTQLRLMRKVRRGGKSNLTRSQKAWFRNATNYGPGRKVATAANMAEDFEEVYEHPILDLLSNPSGYGIGVTEAEMRFLNRMFTGNSYTLVVRQGDNGPPIELHELCPSWVTIRPSKQDFIEGYFYGRDQQQRILLSPEEIIHGIETRDPSAPYRGRGVMALIPLEHQAYMATLQKQLATMDNQGRPDFIVSTENPLNPEQTSQLRQQIMALTQGVGKQGKFLMFPKTTSITPMQFPPKDLAESQQLKDLASSIAAAFGIAESSIFLNTANLASAEVGRVETARTAVLPRLQKDAAVLNERLVPMFADLERQGAWLAYDNPVPEDDAKKSGILVSLVGKVLTLNETRAEMGYEPVEGGDAESLDIKRPSPFADPGFPRLDRGEDEDKPAEKPEEAEKPTPEPDPEPEPEEEKRAKPAPLSVKSDSPKPPKCCEHGNAPRASLKSAHARADAEWVKQAPTLHPEGDQNEPLDVSWYRALAGALYRQQAAILSRMDAAPFGLGTRSIRKDRVARELVNQILAAWGIDDPRQWDRMLTEPTIGFVADAVKVGASVGVDQVRETGWTSPNSNDFYTSSARVVEAARQRAETYTETIKGVNDLTAERLKEAIVGSLERGDGLSKMKEAVQEAFSGLTESGVPIAEYRAATIARTETGRAQDDGRIAGWKATEVVSGKQYLLAPGSCEFCEAINTKAAGKAIPLDESFVPLGTTIVGADGGVMVNDYEDTDKPHPNCRCSSIPVLIGEDEQ